MPTLTALKEDYRKLATQAHDVVSDEAKSASDIRTELDRIEPDLKALSEQIKDAEFLDEKRKEFSSISTAEAAAPGPETPDAKGVATPAVPQSIGEELTASPRFKALVEARKSGGSKVESGPIELKASLTSGLGSANVIPQDRQNAILPILFQRLTVADLIPGGATNSNVVRYAKESTATNAAATVAEGAAKPESALNWTVVDEPVRKIANILKASDEMVEDMPQFASWVNGRLVLFVQIHEEAQLLSGTGVSPQLTGILNRTGLTPAQAKGADTIAVAVHKDITKIRVASFMDPDALVFHPNDWEQARLEADSNGQFFGGGPFTGPYGVNGIAGDSYWGQRVVTTQAMTENTILVGAFGTCAQIFRRSGLTVEMTNSDQDDFIKNLITIRAEERLALAVYRPAAFSTVTGI